MLAVCVVNGKENQFKGILQCVIQKATNERNKKIIIIILRVLHLLNYLLKSKIEAKAEQHKHIISDVYRHLTYTTQKH